MKNSQTNFQMIVYEFDQCSLVSFRDSYEGTVYESQGFFSMCISNSELHWQLLYTHSWPSYKNNYCNFTILKSLSETS